MSQDGKEVDGPIISRNVIIKELELTDGIFDGLKARVEAAME